MRLNFWLTNLFRRFASRTAQSNLRRLRRRSAAIVERLEPRQLLTSGAAAVGFETRVNTYTPSDQIDPKIAVDATGDYVVVWISSFQDGSNDGIYAQRYSAKGVALGSEFKVNTYTTGSQLNPSVAMDAGGDFVVTWQSGGEDASGYGVYAQRYNSSGVAQGGEFKVNTYTTGFQGTPSAGMDAEGDFVIAWTSTGQDGSGEGVYAQRYNLAGTAQASEFKVNTYTTGEQNQPSVAMESTGAFVIAWQSDAQDGSSYGIYAQRYNALGFAQGIEFKVNTYTTNVQDDPAIAIDSAGDFVIAWQSSSQDGSGYGIYAQRYNAAGTALGIEFKVNTYTSNPQEFPSVAMDSAGDFVIAWESFTQDGSGTGIYAQRYNSAGMTQGAEFQVNTFTTANQLVPSTAMDAAGDFVMAWSSGDQDGSGYGIYAQRYVATVGPIVTAVLDGTGPRVVQTGDRLASSVTALSVDFSDNMNTVPAGLNSVTNPSNWLLMRYGIDVSNLISGITFAFNASTNRYVALVTFTQPLTDGGYQLVARQSIQDLTGRGLDGEADGVPGGDFRLNFDIAKTLTAGSETLVNTYTTGDQRFPSVAMDAAGDTVAVWMSTGQDGSSYGVYAQRYNAAGVAQGAEFRVNTFTTGAQTEPKVAIDAAGDFVITWESQLQDGSFYGIYAQRYNAAGVAQGSEFQVNSYTTGNQNAPSIAMDSVGDFVIAWSSFGQDGSNYGTYARRYNAAGIAQGGPFQVNTYTTNAQFGARVAMDASGDFVVTWESAGQDGSQYGIYAQRYDSGGIAQGSEFQVNTYTTGNQRFPAIAIDTAGDFVIAWESDNQDGSFYGVYAQRYDAAGTALGSEFRVNTFTAFTQGTVSMGMDSAGDFVVTWQSNAQDGNLYGVYAQRYDAAGVAQGGEFRVNTYTTDEQDLPSVAMDAGGDFIVAWQSDNQDGSGYGIYWQRYQTDMSPWLSQIEPTPRNAAGPLATPVTSSLLAFDADSNDWTGATIQIAINDRSGEDVLAFTNTPNITSSWNASTGTLSLTGTDTVADYRTALRNVTYHDTSASPNTTLTRTIDFQVTDGLLSSNLVSRDVNVFATSNPAVLSGVNGTGTYDENASPIALASNLIVTDPDTTFLTSATVSFTNWQGEDRVNFNNIFALQHTFNQNLTTHTASLMITGSDTLDHYQTLLRSVNYSDVSDNPLTTTRVASFVVSDGLSNSNVVTRNVAVVAINDPPVLSAIESTSLVYQANNPAFPPLPISATLLVGDPDSVNCTKATVQITAGYQNNASGHDVLSFTDQLGITGSFNAATGTLTLSGTSGVGNYRTALRSVTFSSSGSAVSAANRTLTITATDDSGSATAVSLPITRTVTVLTTNAPPGLTGVPAAALAYVRGSAAAILAPNAIVFDADGINLAGATIQVTGNYQNGQDVLGVTNGSGITGSFNAATGTLTLTGVASLANYQAVLRTVTYKTNSNTASTASRTITFIVNDGLAASSAVVRTITLT